jgi:hypothetical protein
MDHQGAVLSVQELANREAIRDCHYRYCRGVDRCDVELLRSVFWPEATADYGGFSGKAYDCIDQFTAFLREQDGTQHILANVLLRIEGATAASEAYLHAYHRFRRPDGAIYDLVVGGRYLDAFELRGGEWRILRRQLVYDWFREYPDAGDLRVGPTAIPTTAAALGRNSAEDPSAAVLGRLAGLRLG